MKKIFIGITLTLTAINLHAMKKAEESKTAVGSPSSSEKFTPKAMEEYGFPQVLKDAYKRKRNRKNLHNLCRLIYITKATISDFYSPNPRLRYGDSGLGRKLEEYHLGIGHHVGKIACRQDWHPDTRQSTINALDKIMKDTLDKNQKEFISRPHN